MRRKCCLALSLLIAVLPLLSCMPDAVPSSGITDATNANRAGTITLNVFAAASLTDAFSEIGENFSAANSGTAVVFNFAGSNQLATQIGQGAPADIFASANETQMNAAIDSGRIISGTQRTFVRNRLVVITPRDNPANLTALQDLAIPGVKVVFAAAEVPVGQYTLAFLDKADADATLGSGYKDAVLANVVSYEQNVRAVLTKISLGEADAGVVYTSDVGVTANSVIQIEIPDPLNTIAGYPIAPLADSAHPDIAQRFMDYVLAPDGQQVLARYGFIPITGEE
ncbi:MAG: molybdate ABC transporter substrate-binding protein [Caldilineaceae bacterium]|nr:molybdate ABC transporter substrate-binding protein [Caldilineaceae bacterium]